jgi:hypothetical protein
MLASGRAAPAGRACPQCKECMAAEETAACSCGAEMHLSCLLSRIRLGQTCTRGAHIISRVHINGRPALNVDSGGRLRFLDPVRSAPRPRRPQRSPPSSPSGPGDEGPQWSGGTPTATAPAPRPRRSRRSPSSSSSGSGDEGPRWSGGTPTATAPAPRPRRSRWSPSSSSSDSGDEDPRWPRGTPTAIAPAPRRPAPPSAAASARDVLEYYLSAEVCAICFEPLENDEGCGVMVLGCRHAFHALCINENRRHRQECPVCRARQRPARACASLP